MFPLLVHFKCSQYSGLGRAKARNQAVTSGLPGVVGAQPQKQCHLLPPEECVSRKLDSGEEPGLDCS